MRENLGQKDCVGMVLDVSFRTIARPLWIWQVDNKFSKLSDNTCTAEIKWEHSQRVLPIIQYSMKLSMSEKVQVNLPKSSFFLTLFLVCG